VITNNFAVGELTSPRAVAPERIWKWRGTPVRCKSGGAPIRREALETFFGRVPHFFGSKSTISCFGEHFRDGQYSLVSFLLTVLLLMVSPCAHPLVKVGARVPMPYGVGTTVRELTNPRVD